MLRYGSHPTRRQVERLVDRLRDRFEHELCDVCGSDEPVSIEPVRGGVAVICENCGTELDVVEFDEAPLHPSL